MRRDELDEYRGYAITNSIPGGQYRVTKWKRTATLQAVPRGLSEDHEEITQTYHLGNLREYRQAIDRIRLAIDRKYSEINS